MKNSTIIKAAAICFIGYIGGRIDLKGGKPCCPYQGHPYHEIKHNVYFASDQNICEADSVIQAIDFSRFSNLNCNK